MASRITRIVANAWAVLVASSILSQAAAPLERVTNTSLALPTSLPTSGYSLVDAFGGLTFDDPVAIVSAPGETNRLFILEQGGRIVVITNLANPTRTDFLDISGKVLGGEPTDERGLLALVFHPGYASNGYFFVYYTGIATTAVPGGSGAMHDILARYRVLAGDANHADTNSEVRLLRQYDEAGNHNGGDLHFGSDGYLYLSLGDEGAGNDDLDNSQTITKDFFSAILRLDVDKRPGSLSPNSHPSVTTNYAIPPDNPFVGATNFNGSAVNPTDVRTEFWAVGLRNPWRFSFDPVTGFLYCADVGQNQYEEVDIITRGGNYGWAYREGLHAGPKSAPGGFTSINPIQEYGHGGGTNQGYCVTGGVVYRGSALPQFVGAYFFADYITGNIWQLRYDGTNTIPFQYVGNEGGISAFGIDPRNGELLMANQYLDKIRRLASAVELAGGPPPPTLADTGAFTNLATLAVAPGIVPYDINVPFWSDQATKQRWFSIPNAVLDMSFNASANWSFPTGTIWIKHFELQLTNGSPASNRRLETRFLVKNDTGIYGLTYRWGDLLTNATLVAEGGLDENFVINDGGGVVRTQVWHYPSRAECLVCHTVAGGYALGFNTPQLNRDFAYPGGTTNQLAALALAGYFDAPVTGLHTARALAHPTNGAVSLEYRVRSYLSANCAHCHQPGGTAQGLWDARVMTPTASAGLINGPLVNNGGNTNNRAIVSGSLSNSMLLSRISTLGVGRMPPLDSTVLDTNAINLLSSWITNDLPAEPTFAQWQITYFGSTNAPAAGQQADPDGDRSVNYLEYLTATHPQDSNSAWNISIQRTGSVVQVTFPQNSNRAFEVQSALNLTGTSAWSALDVPGNEPFFAKSNRTGRVSDSLLGGSNKYYRVRVYAP